MSLHKRTTRAQRRSVAEAGLAAGADSDRSALGAEKKFGGCRRLVRRWLLRLILLIIVIGAVIPFGVYISQPRYFTVLVIGSDQRGAEQARSDALILVSIPKSAVDPFSMIMVPRDTKIDHPEKGMQKLTHFYAMWENEDEYLGNRELTQSVIEEALDITIDGTVEVTFDSFSEIVDLLGGVDTAAGHLDGAAAREIVHNRYNKAGGDFGRGAAQREILRNLLSRMKTPANALAVRDYFANTNRARLHVPIRQAGLFGVAYLIGHRGQMSLGEAEEVVLPGNGQKIYTSDFGKELYYWVLDEAGTAQVVEQYLE